jgi:hypothetical protein
MNETNWLEAQLKSWAPRRPSGKIERGLFARRARARASEFARALAWLTPAAACMVFALGALRPEGSAGAASRPEYLFAMVLSNQAAANILHSDAAQPENRVVRASFEWTNRGDSGSSIRFMPLTNSSY